MKLKLPDFPQDDGFSEWVERLYELDPYYIGLVDSIANGSNVQIDDMHFMKLKADLIKFSALKEDNDIYVKCVNYIQSLEKLLEKVTEHKKN